MKEVQRWGSGGEDVIYQAGAMVLEHRIGVHCNVLGLVGEDQGQGSGWLADPVGLVAGVDGLESNGTICGAATRGEDEGYVGLWLEHLAFDVCGGDGRLEDG